MIEALVLGLVAGSSLLLGAVAALALSPGRRLTGAVMAFGGGVLISAVTFELTQEAYLAAGAWPVVLGLAAGTLAFFAGDLLVDRRAGENRKRSGHAPPPPRGPAEGAALAIVLGAVLDGVPESVAIGASLVGGGEGAGAAFVAAVFLSNVPEAMAASHGMRAAGRPAGRILALWAAVTAVAGLAALAGYALLRDASEDVLAVAQAFAAGAILTMLADTMMPEAFEQSGARPYVGLLTVAGFTAGAALTVL